MGDGPSPAAAAPPPPSISAAPAPPPAPVAQPTGPAVALAPPAQAAAGPRPTDSKNVDPLQPLLLLQAFDGAWTLGEPLAAVLGMASSALAPPEPSLPEKAWGTALGLAFLQLRFSARQEEWALVAQKARAWLQAAGHDAEMLVVRAREVLQGEGAN